MSWSLVISSIAFINLYPFVFSSPKELSTTIGTPPRLRENTPNYLEVPMGQRVKLRCPIAGVPKPFVEWLKSNESISSASERIKITKNSLTIDNVTEADSDTYFCKAFNEHGIVWKNFTVLVIDPLPLDEAQADDSGLRTRALIKPGEKFAPYFTQLSKMEIQLIARPASSSVTLKCPANGNPVPEIKWLKNGKVPERELQKEVIYRKYSLTMDQLQSSDSGKYECIVSNSEGSVNWTYKLEVYERVPHKPIFKDGYLTNQTVYVGGRARFECRFLSDLQPRMRWLRHYSINGSYTDSSETPYVTPLESTDPNITDPHILVIDNVTEADEAWYSCIVGNSLGVSYRSAYLTVLPLPDESDPEPSELLSKLENSPFLILFIALSIFIPMCVIIGIIICKYKYSEKKIYLKNSHMIVSKKVILETREDDGTTSVVPFVKIDYNMVFSNDRNSVPEYELPLDPAWEFPRERLIIGHMLGEGAFGKVVRADAFGLNGNDGSTTVAVKMLKDAHSDSEMAVLVSEMEMMKIIGRHMNIVSLLGCCTDGQLFVIVEYAAKGNLRDYLRAHRHSSGYEQPIGANTNSTTLSLKDLVSFAYQAARGMEYLASKKCIHRDLAARNVLLTDDDVIKIADFGLARDIHGNDYYKKTTGGVLPIKWMAPEALYDRIFTCESDVWSFGILMWEIMTLGGSPYPTIPYEKLYQKLKEGHRMAKPDHCPMNMYLLMRDCWMDDPDERPSFAEIAKLLDRILLESLERTYLELDFPIISTPENSSSGEEN